MPYTRPEHRPPLDPHVDRLCVQIHRLRETTGKGVAGFANYSITRLLLKLLGVKDLTNIPPIGSHDYDRINEAIGMLECCKLELYRRLAAPYEDTKIEQNGDVLEPIPWAEHPTNPASAYQGPCSPSKRHDAGKSEHMEDEFPVPGCTCTSCTEGR